MRHLGCGVARVADKQAVAAVRAAVCALPDRKAGGRSIDTAKGYGSEARAGATRRVSRSVSRSSQPKCRTWVSRSGIRSEPQVLCPRVAGSGLVQRAVPAGDRHIETWQAQRGAVPSWTDKVSRIIQLRARRPGPTPATLRGHASANQTELLSSLEVVQGMPR